MGEYEAHAKRMRQTICDSVLKLVGEKPFAKVTIQDILNAAQIQRATFYRYFRDKYELAEVISESIALQMCEMVFCDFYGGTRCSYEDLMRFDLKYHKVLQELMNLKEESLDFSQTLLRIFSGMYAKAFPDAREFEIYLASRNFLAFVRWHIERDSSLQEIRASVRADDQLKWFVRFCNVGMKQLPDSALPGIS